MIILDSHKDLLENIDFLNKKIDFLKENELDQYALVLELLVKNLKKILEINEKIETIKNILDDTHLEIDSTSLNSFVKYYLIQAEISLKNLKENPAKKDFLRVC